MVMDANTKALLKTWFPTMALFIIIALVCITYIFAPVQEEFDEVVTSRAATSLEGLALRGESWKRYPHYNIGLGIAAVLSFAGGGFCVYQMGRDPCEG